MAKEGCHVCLKSFLVIPFPLVCCTSYFLVVPDKDNELCMH